VNQTQKTARRNLTEIAGDAYIDDVRWTLDGHGPCPYLILEVTSATVERRLQRWAQPGWEIGQVGELSWGMVTLHPEDNAEDPATGLIEDGDDTPPQYLGFLARVRLAAVGLTAGGDEQTETKTLTMTFLLPDDLPLLHQIVETGYFYVGTTPGTLKRLPCHLDWEELYSILREDGLWNPTLLEK